MICISLHLDPRIRLGSVPGHAVRHPLAAPARHQSAQRPSAAGPVPSQFVLPVAVLVLYDFGYVARMIRVSMIGVMEKPYIRTAVLKGMSMRQVVLGHALRNAMIAPFTVLLLQINFLISGVVVTELVFAYPGFGRLHARGQPVRRCRHASRRRR